MIEEVLDEPIELHDGTVVLHDIRELKQDDAALFDMYVKTLLYYQHKVEDIANVATRFLSEARNKYNHFLDHYEPFLREYAKEHLKRGADGEIKGKSYKSISCGGGVFFRGKPERISFNKDRLPQMKEFIERYLPDKVEVIIEKTVYEVPDDQALVDILQQIADVKAREIFTNPEEITVGQVKGLEEIYREFGIEIEDADPFHHFYVGSTTAFTGASLKAILNKALDGRIEFNDQEENDLLLKELQ